MVEALKHGRPRRGRPTCDAQVAPHADAIKDGATITEVAKAAGVVTNTVLAYLRRCRPDLLQLHNERKAAKKAKAHAVSEDPDRFTLSAKALAERHGVSVHAATLARGTVVGHNQQQAYAFWSQVEELGKFSDYAVAVSLTEAGHPVSEGAVKRWRNLLGIPSYRDGQTLTKEDLERVQCWLHTDEETAELLGGVTVERVSLARRRFGLTSRGHKASTATREQLLEAGASAVPDSVVAERFGMSARWVADQRKRHGIPAWRRHREG